jgi:hypothetical protein
MHNVRSENTLKLKNQRGRHHFVDLEIYDISIKIIYEKQDSRVLTAFKGLRSW